MEYKVKKLYFGDVRKVAQTFTELGLSSTQVKEIYELFTKFQEQTSFKTVEVADAYIQQNMTKAEYTKVKKTLVDDSAILSYATKVKMEKTKIVDDILTQSFVLIDILATKFDVIVDFLEYFLSNIEKKTILSFDGNDTKKAFLAIFANAGFLQYFKSFFS